jgi:hypothetical protein
MNNKPRLDVKPGRDPQRRDHQSQVKTAIIEGQAWSLTYLLARVQDHRPYSNYSTPKELEVFEFTVKGVVRLEMMAQEGYKGWRRMFGSNTKAHEISTWRSRVSIQAFGDLAQAQAYVSTDPLLTWNEQSCALLDDLPSDDWYVLFQVNDVWLPGGKYRWSDLLESYLKTGSRLLAFAGRCDVLPAVRFRGEENG